MRILVTNDDGVGAPGIQFLAEAMTEFGEVTVVAPDRERSGAGHSLTLHRPLRIHPKGERRFAVDGTPTDCVSLACKAIMKDHPPDLVVSGINLGANLGDDITYSGTVSAALEGAIMGIPSLAISLAATIDETPNFAPAAFFVAKIVRQLLKRKFPNDVVLNINVPNCADGKLPAHEITRMGKRDYGDIIEEKLDPRGKKYYWIGGDLIFGLDASPGTDTNAIREGRISVTPIRLDFTHDQYLETLRGWEL